MNEKEGNKILNQGDDKVHIYENDDAYLFGEEMSGDGSLEVGYKNSFKENEKKIISQKELLNKFNTNLSQDDEQEDEIQNEEILSNENNNNENNNLNNNINNNNNNDINNQIKNINNSLQDNKYMINDINSDENEEGGEGDDEDNQENENLSFGENANENEKIDDNYLIDNSKIQKNTLNNNNMNNNINNNEKDIDNNDNQMNEEIDENESNDSGVPLVTLNFLSICQCCKNSFNSKDNIPYLFKCGHFFCKQCIIEQFTDEEGIKCPNDGLIANSISDLKILNNFITDKTVTQRTSSPFSSPEAVATTGEKKNPKTKNVISSNINIDNSNQNLPYKCCEFHKGQKLTHFIEETKELICVYCAFERFKQNQGIQIKEIGEKCHDMESEMDSIIEENQYNVGIIQTSLKEIKKNKESEEKKINEIYDRFIEIIKSKKEEYLNKVENLFTNNAEKLSQKLELFSSKIEKSESLKEKINLFLNNQDTSQFLQLYELYNKIINELQSVHSLKLNLQKYKFVYEDEMPISRMISKFGEIKLTPKIFNFIGNSSKEEPEIINDSSNYNNMKNCRGIKVKLNNNNSNYNDMNINIEGNNNNCGNHFQTYNNMINDDNNKATREDLNIKNNSSTNFYKRSLNINNNNNYKINNINNHNPKNIKCNQQQPQQYIDYSSHQPDNSNSNCINNNNHIYKINSLYNNKKVDNNNMINYDKYSIPTHLNNNNEISNKCRNSSLNGGIRVNTPNSLSKMYNNRSSNNNNHLNIKNNNLYDNSLNKKINKYKINLSQMKNNRNPKTKNNKKYSLQFKYNTNIKSDIYKNKSYTFLDK
jgi:hypothetical protein